MHARKILVVFSKSLICYLVLFQALAQITDLEKLKGLTLVDHPTCVIYQQRELPTHLQEPLNKIFEEKGYTVKLYKKGQRVVPGEFKVTVKKKLMGSFYKSCFVEVEIFKINSDYPSLTDTSIMRKSSTRKFPRHTLEGNERCKLAVKDMSYDINPCKKKE